MLKKAGINDIYDVVKIWREYVRETDYIMENIEPTDNDYIFWHQILSDDSQNVLVKYHRKKPIGFSHAVIQKSIVTKPILYIIGIYERMKEYKKWKELYDTQVYWGTNRGVKYIKLQSHFSKKEKEFVSELGLEPMTIGYMMEVN